MNAIHHWNRLAIMVILFAGCTQSGMPVSMNTTTTPLSPGHHPLSERPAAGRTLLLVGQDVLNIDAYLQQVDPDPAGFMIYTDIRHLSGLDTRAEDGGGIRHAAHYTNNPAYDHTVLQLGLWMVNDLKNIASGSRDRQIKKVGQWISSVNRPVYLRIGYEFDGPWNHYEPSDYIKAYRHIVDQLRAMDVRNVIYVWASAVVPGYHGHPLETWYPGKDYVDWVGLSVFRQFDGTLGQREDLHRVCTFAQTHHHPIGIMEATPFGSITGITEKTWANWFMPVFDLIEQYDIRMLCYINANWESQKMWAGQGWGDTRLQNNPAVMKKWLTETSKPRYIHARDLLMDKRQ